jgi:hypothetical protein
MRGHSALFRLRYRLSITGSSVPNTTVPNNPGNISPYQTPYGCPA